MRLPLPARAGALASTLALAGALLLVAPAASAHVTVIPERTAAGGWARLTFRVPNESASAGTTRLQVRLPAESPLLHVSALAVPGWTATVERAALANPVTSHGTEITEAPSVVTWTADPGVQIGPGQFLEFAISGGPLPEAGTTLVLPAEQTYSDGTVVAWDEVAAGDEEPAHPAPAFTVTTAEGDAHGAATDVTPTAASDNAVAAEPAAQQGSDADSGQAGGDSAGDGGAAGGDPVARALGGLGAVAGLLALALTWARRRTAAAPEARSEVRPSGEQRR
ncbi:YcnI family protein [Cellulomonas timonensis]|uniref:YcnI family protein n=1 Tax=Cellulomonas timonensis TaxID=1689271 RepID=UPI000831FE79|nr:YcnI family protein [Cellulomonas timonensis]